MQAKYRGHCGKCGAVINVGDEISWSRQERGKVYHIACRTAPTVSATPIPAPTSDSAVLAELLRKLMAASAAPVAVAEAEQEEPDASDFEPLPVPVAKTASKPTARKLTNSSPWYDVLAAVLPYVNRVLLVGPPSTGKSHTAMLAAGTKHRITMTETTSREDLIGMHHLLDGATKFVGVNFTVAMQKGEKVLIDEMDRYSPECASLAYSLIDDQPHINLPTGELIEAADGYGAIMTTNETIDALPAAVQDRIEVIIMASTPHPAALEKEGITPAMKAVCQRYYAGQPVVSIKLPPTVRRMRSFANLLSHGIPDEIAARLVFGNAGASEVLSAITSAEGR